MINFGSPVSSVELNQNRDHTPTVNTLAAAAVQGATFLAEQPLNTLDTANYMDILDKLLTDVDDQHYERDLSDDAKAAMRGVMTVAGRYFERVGELGRLNRLYLGVNRPRERTERRLALFLIRELKIVFRVGVHRSQTDRQAALLDVQRELPLFGAAFAVSALDLSSNKQVMGKYDRLHYADALRALSVF